MITSFPAISDFECQHTPNPRVRKFSVLGGRDRGITEANADDVSQIEGVSNVFLGNDFLSVRSLDDAFSDCLARDVLDYLDARAAARDWPTPLMANLSKENDPTDAGIKKLLNELVRPAAAADGGDIEFVSFVNGSLTLKMRGACDGCPSASATLQMGVMRLFRQTFPCVKRVRAV
ncbi:NifU family protein [Roseibium sp. RKSG952]|uniref:NifU family protein n=1 Tax=Roseibium sp. RKSG952 TaxID=2529384 RepID=UPI0018AD12EE|nr:NifU family protein [Roseibium sp. RKSG952]